MARAPRADRHLRGLRALRVGLPPPRGPPRRGERPGPARRGAAVALRSTLRADGDLVGVPRPAAVTEHRERDGHGRARRGGQPRLLRRRRPRGLEAGRPGVRLLQGARRALGQQVRRHAGAAPAAHAEDLRRRPGAGLLLVTAHGGRLPGHRGPLDRLRGPAVRLQGQPRERLRHVHRAARPALPAGRLDHDRRDRRHGGAGRLPVHADPHLLQLADHDPQPALHQRQGRQLGRAQLPPHQDDPRGDLRHAAREARGLLRGHPRADPAAPLHAEGLLPGLLHGLRGLGARGAGVRVRDHPGLVRGAA